MASISRRKAIFGAAGLAVGVGAVRLWYLHQTLPPRDPAAEDHFRQAQDRLLSENGGSIHSRFVQLANPNIRAQVLEGGQGEPVLLVHGGNGIAAQWESLLSRLSSGFHVFAPDRPGCGLTDMFDYSHIPLREHAVAFLGSTMDALGLKTATLIGNSMGGYFSLVFALAHPERVSRLITVGEPAGSSAIIRPSHRLLSTRGINGILYSTVMKPGPSATYEGFKRMLVAHPERLSKTYLDCRTAGSEIPGATESWLTMLEDGITKHGRSTLTYALRPELAKLTMPTLMIWGDKDTFGPPSLATEMAGMMPQGKAEVIHDAGHLAWLDQPDEVETLIRSFLRS